MFWVDNLIGDFLGSLYGSKASRWGWGYRGSSPRWKRYYNVWQNQAQANTPRESNWGYKPSSKDKYVRDSMESMRYYDPKKYRF